MDSNAVIPITVFTGFLGAGKTTLIMSALKALPKDYKVAFLKNEFGNVEVDSELAKYTAESSIAVKEMMNGCLCCVLVGQMQTALKELRDEFHPDRIIVETSGSAFPATVAWQIRQLEPEGFKLDAVITVIDCLNFQGYADKSPTAKMQAKYTDLIILNKHELVDERQYDHVIDLVNDLNTDTPKVKSHGQTISPDLVFGIDTKLFVEAPEVSHANLGHMDIEVDLIQVNSAVPVKLSREEVESLFASLPSDRFYRIKGFVTYPNGETILYNYAFGRPGSYKLPPREEADNIRLVFMGDDLGDYMESIREKLGVAQGAIKLTLVMSGS